MHLSFGLNKIFPNLLWDKSLSPVGSVGSLAILSGAISLLLMTAVLFLKIEKRLTRGLYVLFGISTVFLVVASTQLIWVTVGIVSLAVFVYILSSESSSSLPKSNIKTGLDLSGGSRALIKAKDRDLSASETNDLIAVINNRFNVYGIADIVILPVSDLDGNNFVFIYQN